LAFLVEIGRRGTSQPNLSPRQIFLRTSALDASAGHADFFRCEIHLDAASNAIAFALEDARQPFATHNPELLNVLIPRLQETAPAAPNSAAARVRPVSANASADGGPRPTKWRVNWR